MAESDFSWFKIASFFGAILLVFVFFVMMGFGINLIYSGSILYGVMCIISSLVAGACAFLVYKNYQNKT